MNLEFSRQFFSEKKKYPNIKFHKNPSGRRADGKKELMKLIAAFRNFKNSPKNTTTAKQSSVLVSTKYSG